MELTEALRQAIAQAAEQPGVSPADLTLAMQRLSERYRTDAVGPGPAVATPAMLLAYVVGRMPATWAALVAAMQAGAQSQAAAARPETLLDVGGGPGTALWAADRVWPDLTRMTVVERDPRMAAMGRRLAAASPTRAVREATWLNVPVLGEWPAGPYDVVVLSYVLSELPPGDLPAVLDRLWRATGQMLVLVEPGTPPASGGVERFRQAWIERGGFTLAPCPHNHACPLAGPDWCHFSVRVARSAMHRRLKGGTAPYEDEKFSYAVLSKSPGHPVPARIIRHPWIQPGHIGLTLCTPDGIVAEGVRRSAKATFTKARKAGWGSSWPPA